MGKTRSPALAIEQGVEQITKGPRRVLVIEHSEELADLACWGLETGGHEAEGIHDGANLLSEVRTRQPNLLLLDLISGDSVGGFRLLDGLRIDRATSHIPVVVMVSEEAVGGRALASYNVRATVLKPYDLPQLLAKVQEALQLPAIPPAPPTSRDDGEGILGQAQRILAEHSPETLFEWIQRLQEEEPWKHRRGLRLAGFIDYVPTLVEAISSALLYRDPEEFFRHHPDALERARLHAVIRRKQAIPLAAVIREFTLLRNEIWKTLCRFLPGKVSIDDVLALQVAVNLTLDRIIEITVPAYLEMEGAPQEAE
jgi:CheY-like chemotaxis protein